MKLQAKIWLGSGLMIATIMAIDMIYGYRNIQAEIQEQLDNDARIIQAVLMSTRRIYHQQFLASGLPLNEHTIGFLPAHALSRISADFPNWLKTGLRFNNVSDKPRNPANQADANELAAMDWFRANPAAPDRVSAIDDAQGKRYYHFTSPIWIENYCLKCHGERADAPPSIRDSYAESYGYKLGELRGLLSIKLPMDEISSKATHSWLQRFAVRFAGYVLLLLLLGSLLQRLVTRRLASLEAAAHQLEKGDLTARVTISGHDEVTRLANSFNSMADAIAGHEKQMLRLNNIYAALSNTNQTIVRVDDEAVLLDRVCHIAVEHGRLSMAWLGRADPETHLFKVISAFGNGLDYLQGIEISADPASPFGNGPSGTAWRTQKAVVVEEFGADKLTSPWRNHARPPVGEAAPPFPFCVQAKLTWCLICITKIHLPLTHGCSICCPK